ncbi:hypothetical protein ACJRO7_011442 [Eucalyptus globulus]|uniref:Response regulatory domain-containing protein n=1 Tax=Eucalyptus globulus TaxID=34317 RepID=A0ABD3LF49_EUCGL
MVPREMMSKQVAGATSPCLRSTGSEKAKMGDETRLSVLIVDDDSMIRTIHTILVNRVGMVVESQVAVYFIIMRTFNVILMDWEMPELRNIGVSSMIGGVTSHSMHTEEDTFMAAGLDDCYGKPLLIKILKNILQKMKIDNLVLECGKNLVFFSCRLNG